jgi:hypothetical protein
VIPNDRSATATVVGVKVKALETIDLSVPENLEWAQEQWDQLVETNEWLRKRELDLLQQISELRNDYAQLQLKK